MSATAAGLGLLLGREVVGSPADRDRAVADADAVALALRLGADALDQQPGRAIEHEIGPQGIAFLVQVAGHVEGDRLDEDDDSLLGGLLN